MPTHVLFVQKCCLFKQNDMIWVEKFPLLWVFLRHLSGSWSDAIHKLRLTHVSTCLTLNLQLKIDLGNKLILNLLKSTSSKHEIQRLDYHSALKWI